VELAVLTGIAAYTCPTYFELHAGFRDPELPRLNAGLARCERVWFKPAYWEAAGRLARALRAQGVTVPNEDVYIAAAASELSLPLLCRDKHFDVIREKGGLALELEQMA